MHSKAILWICLLALSSVTGQKYRVCSEINNAKDCEQLKRNSNVHCNLNQHSVDCLIDVNEGRTDFGRVTAEEALIAAPLTNNLVAIAEFRPVSTISDDSAYATVVLVRSNFSGGFDFKGKRYCHPGFKYDPKVTDFLLKQFENKVLKENKVNQCANVVETGTLHEKQLNAVRDYFGPSCRPGPWIDLADINSKFYSKYSKLCELCLPNRSCELISGAEPFLDALQCLVHREGDVAVSTLHRVHEYFNITGNAQYQKDYSYLCLNGTVSPLSNPCVWSKQPWDLLVANKDKAQAIRLDIGTWFSQDLVVVPSIGQNEAALDTYLKPILDINNYRIQLLDSSNKSLKSYLEEYRTIPNALESERCRSNVKWCTGSKEEQSKCEWLAQASLNRGIQPIINCRQSKFNKFSCLEDINAGDADVVTADAHYGYITRKKKLAPLAYPETLESYDLIKTVVVIRNNDTTIKFFKDLKNKRACIPEYGGLEWLSFINTAQGHGVMSKSICDYGALISDFVGDSCIPGAIDEEHGISHSTDKAKLCNLCVPSENYTSTAAICNANSNNKYYGNEGALECLKHSGDFAVVTLKEYPNLNLDDFRVLCKDGVLAGHSGFNVTEDCTLAAIVDSEVISKMNGSKNADIKNILLNFEKRFGSDREKPFEVFNTFNHTKDLLFKDTTIGLAAVTSNNKYISNYLKLFERVDKCVKDGKGGSEMVEPAIFCIILSSIIVLFQR